MAENPLTFRRQTNSMVVINLSLIQQSEAALFSVVTDKLKLAWNIEA